MTTYTLEKFEIRNRFTNAVQVTAEISVTPDMSWSVKLGLAIRWAIKSGADLSGADLSGADLSRADLSRAYLSRAYLSRAKDADLAIARTRILPDGALIGWKKCRDNVIVKLRIPEDAPRSHAFGRKCRAQFAEVLEIFGADEAISQHDANFTYRTGERVEAPNWSADWEEECSGGIHFFIQRAEAEAY